MSLRMELYGQRYGKFIVDYVDLLIDHKIFMGRIDLSMSDLIDWSIVQVSSLTFF